MDMSYEKGLNANCFYSSNSVLEIFVSGGG